MMTEHPGVDAGFNSWLCCQHAPASVLQEGSNLREDCIYAPWGWTISGHAMVMFPLPWWMAADARGDLLQGKGWACES